MEQSKWRTWAKFVAFVDLATQVLLSIDFIFVFFLMFHSSGLSAASFYDSDEIKISTIWIRVKASESKEDSLNPGLDSCKVWILWLLIAFLALVTSIQMWAAIKLLVSTEVEREPKKAVGNARIWRNINSLSGFVNPLLFWAPTLDDCATDFLARLLSLHRPQVYPRALARHLSIWKEPFC